MTFSLFTSLNKIWRPQEYTPLSNDTGANSMSEKSDLDIPDVHTARSLSLRTLFTALGVVIALIGGIIVGRQTITSHDCGKMLSTWSPAMDAVEYYQTTFSGEFLEASVWRGEPSPALDEAWDRVSLGGAGSLRISKGDLGRINKTSDADIIFGFGDGTDGVQVLLEVFHQLHCLLNVQNEIRKHTWPEYYTFDAAPRIDRAHLDHCIEMIRINLMCTADITPITAKEVAWKPNGQVAPDFSTLHTCRNFSRILSYVEEHSERWGTWA